MLLQIVVVVKLRVFPFNLLLGRLFFAYDLDTVDTVLNAEWVFFKSKASFTV